MRSIDRCVRKYLITAAIVVALLLPLTTFNQIVLAQSDVVIDVVESITVTDSPEVLPPVSINVSESITVTDSPEVLPPVSINVSESITVTDSPEALPPVSINVSESITVSDSNQIQVNDTTPPECILTAYTPDPSNDNTPSYTGTVNDAMSNIVDIEFRVNGESWTDVDPFTPALSVNFTFTTPLLLDGLNIIEVRAQDEASNWSNIASDTITIDTTNDTTAPSAVTNLRVSQTSSTWMTLVWTASGDDGNTGTASQYDVRYSTSVITDANWDSATPWPYAPPPKPAGSSEAMTVLNLSEGTRYYFALKTADEVPNWSGLSNVVSGISPVPVSGGCFIATAAYGTPIAEEIQVLRDFRDQYLLTNPAGKKMVITYYRVSPPMAEYIVEHPSLKPLVRFALQPAIVFSSVAVQTTTMEKIAIALAVLSLLFVLRQRQGRSKAN